MSYSESRENGQDDMADVAFIVVLERVEGVVVNADEQGLLPEPKMDGQHGPVS